MNLIYNVKQKPKISEIIFCAFQQLLAILSATIAVPYIVGNGMSQSAALFGAGAGTLIYLLFTKFNSPVFLGSSFAFIESMGVAFAGAVSVGEGYFGLIFGAFCAGLVYVILALIVKKFGVNWIDKLMPSEIIGPTVAIIGLSLASNAIGDLTSMGYKGLIAGLIALLVTVFISVKGNKTLKLIPFIIGIGAGYIICLLFGLVDFSAFNNLVWVPEFTFIKVFSENQKINFSYLITVLISYSTVAFVVFAEHIADHKNLSSIIGKDLLKEPGLHRTLLGDGVGSMVGAFFGGCPNTTYGESVACTAISGNASIYVTFTTALMAIVCSFIAPITALLSTIPSCVLGGVCMTLYGFIAVSGLKMIQKVDLDNNANLFTVASILIAGVGGLTVSFGSVKLTSVACALLLGIIVNLIGKIKCGKK